MSSFVVWAATAYVLGVVFFINCGLRYREHEGVGALSLLGVVFIAVGWPLLLVSLVAAGLVEAVRQR